MLTELHSQNYFTLTELCYGNTLCILHVELLHYVTLMELNYEFYCISRIHCVTGISQCITLMKKCYIPGVPLY